GRIQMQGSYHSIATSSLEYARLLIPSETEKQTDSDRPDYEREVSRERSIKQRRNRSRMNSVSSITSLRSMSLNSSYADLGDLNLEEPDKFLEEKPVLTNAEESSKGAVEGSVGMHYIKAATNWFGIILAVLLFTGTQALASFFDYFVAFWTSQEEKRQHHSVPNFTTTENSVDVFKSTPITEASISNYTDNDVPSVGQLFIYPPNALITVGGVTVILILIVGLLRAFHFYNCCIRASQTLHDLMFRAPSSDADYHIVSKITRQDESNEPKLDGVASFNYGVLWPPSSSIIRPWLPYSIKVLVKTNQTSPNSMGLRRLITEFLWPPSIHHQT
ncbi:hypothetical protein EVAR_71487_1, partial [Eumeta japonica]